MIEQVPGCIVKTQEPGELCMHCLSVKTPQSAVATIRTEILITKRDTNYRPNKE